VFDIEAMVKDGAVDHPSRLFEAVIAFARKQGHEASTYTLSDRQGARVFGDAAVEVILEFLPKALQGLWKRGLHYRVRSLARA
jgi:hypothetical protein